MWVKLKWKKAQAGRSVGFEEQWDMSAQSALAEKWEAAGWCEIVKSKPANVEDRMVRPKSSAPEARKK